MISWGIGNTRRIAVKVGEATHTTASTGTAAAEVAEARLGRVVARDVATGAAPDEITGAVAATLVEATADGGMEREAVPTGTARRPPSTRLLPRVQTTAR